ncbi:MAG: ribonuclease P protein component [Proteobacteria bacterium]|nr:MAG: ribonuclease P protein component [Pseudomonadota bacterium]
MPREGGRRETFPRNQRLLNSRDFRNVFRQRRKTAARCGSLHASRNGLGYTRLGITVSRKVSKRAVERNRIKRLVREYFRKNKTLADGADLVFTAFPTCTALTNREFVDALDQLWRRTAVKCAR